MKRSGIIGVLTLFLALPGWAQDITNLGGDLTSEVARQQSLQLPTPNILSEERKNFFLAGHSQFHTPFQFLDQVNKRLGPTFNHESCVGCHIADGKGPIRFSKSLPGSPMLIKVALRGLNADGSPRDVPGVGEQLQDHSLKNKTRFAIRLAYKELAGTYPDGTSYSLRRPIINFVIPGYKQSQIAFSVRMSPVVIGSGLLEAFTDQQIEALADPYDLNGDGISGKVMYVPDRASGEKKVGRFGFRASHTTVEQQSAAALFNDMGVTSKLFRIGIKEPEISDLDLEKITFYLQAAGVPPAINQDNPAVIAGKELFKQVKCDSCHMMTLQTGTATIPEVANQTFHPFTDLLLHDMGPEMKDKRAEFSANGREFRTTPLWGLGLYQILGRHKPGFMHDGRARSIEEAILWHGGEADASRQLFKHLPKVQRHQLVEFLKSL